MDDQHNLFDDIPDDELNAHNDPVPSDEGVDQESSSTIDSENEEDDVEETVDEPRVKKVRSAKGRYVILAILLLAVAGIVSYYNSKAFVIKKVTVDGEYFTPARAIIKQAAVPANINPDSLNFLTVISRVEKLPYVRQAFVRVIPPNTLHIQVEERQPAAMLIKGDNRMYVDTSGVKLPIVEGKIVNVPLVYGFNATGAGDTVKSEHFKTISHFLEQLQSHKLANVTLSEITYIPDDGIVALTQNNGVKVIFGKSDFNQRLAYWDAFYEQVVPKKGIDKFYFVDLRYQGQVVTNKIKSAVKQF